MAKKKSKKKKPEGETEDVDYSEYAPGAEQGEELECDTTEECELFEARESFQNTVTKSRQQQELLENRISIERTKKVKGYITTGATSGCYIILLVIFIYILIQVFTNPDFFSNILENLGIDLGEMGGGGELGYSELPTLCPIT